MKIKVNPHAHTTTKTINEHLIKAIQNGKNPNSHRIIKKKDRTNKKQIAYNFNTHTDTHIHIQTIRYRNL